MLYKMTQLGENEFRAGQPAGIEATRHAKYNRIADNTGCGAGHDGCGINFFHAEFGEQGSKCAQLFVKKRADGFNGHILFRNAGAATHKNHLGL